MKSRLYILLVAMAVVSTFTFVSCSDDDLGPSIFDTTEYPLDRSNYSFPLDSFLKAEFLKPYNVKVIYRMEDIGSDMDKNLVPAAYDKSEQLAVLMKYLWYDVYKECAGEQFLKEYSPRIIHCIGSKSYNPSQGTETLGVAEGGVKITLYNVNNLNPADIDYMNEYFFKTMHHEFGHILDQNHLRPTTFNTISNTHYNSQWSDMADSVAAGLGFVSPYASSAAGEDWVEVLANYVTRDPFKWAQLLNSASFDWETEEVDGVNEYTKRLKPGCNLDTIGYFKATTSGKGTIYRRACVRNEKDNVVLDENGEVQWTHLSGVDGRGVILQKLDLVRTYMKDNYNIDIDQLRNMVQSRQFIVNSDGTYATDEYGRLINNLTSPSAEDPSRSVIDVLLDKINVFKSLQ
jgi:substrate import-associated zinc metallohydrolase lipoprotein